MSTELPHGFQEMARTDADFIFTTREGGAITPDKITPDKITPENVNKWITIPVKTSGGSVLGTKSN